jgi:hypothetical protein
LRLRANGRGEDLSADTSPDLAKAIGEAWDEPRHPPSAAASHLIRPRFAISSGQLAFPKQDRYWLAVGLGYQWTADLHLDATYVLSLVAVRQSNEMSQTGDLLIGRYSGRIDVVSLSATLRF